MPLLSRLRRLTRAEASHRVRTTGRTYAQRVVARFRPPQWDRAQLLDALAPAVVDDDLAAALRREDWPHVHHRLRDALRSRPSRFVLRPGDATALQDSITARWPDAARQAAACADGLVRREIDLLGYRGLRFSASRGLIDWHLDPVHDRRMPLRFWADVPYLDPHYGDHKIIWELNRHQHWLKLGRAYWLTGRAQYAEIILAELYDWLDQNPPLTGVNWASMLELAFRCQSWVWALHFLLESAASEKPWLVDLLLGLHQQLTHVEQNLSYYFSPNTHLTGEALALYVAGTALPELGASARWTDTGRRILIDELARQVCRDGGHAERSTHYHRYTLDFYLLALLTAERSGDSEAAAIFSEAVSRLALFQRAIADDRGWVAQIGDDDGGMLCPIAGRDPRDVRDALSLAATVLGRPELAPWGVTEETYWLAWSARSAALTRPAVDERVVPARATSLETFEDSGYVVIRNDDGDHLVFDGGPHGYLNGGHAHADALSVVLTLHGQPLLIDPGTATYTVRPDLRDGLRSTAAHNTVTLDGRPSARPSGPFHWATRADARIHRGRGNARFAWTEAAHNGFGAIEHRRRIVHGPDCGWLIVDDLLGNDRHAAQARWHFDPAWTVRSDGRDRLRADTADGREAWLICDGDGVELIRGDRSSSLGWCSPCYGSLVPTWSATVTRTAAAPFSIVSWVGAGNGELPPLLERVHVPEVGTGTLAVRVRRGPASIVTLLRSDKPANTSDLALPDYYTDSRVLQYSSSRNALTSLTVIDGTHALARQDGFLSVTSPTMLHDLTAELGDGELDLWSSAPAAMLTIQGSPLRTVHTLRLNGRGWRAAADAGDTIVVSGAEWAEPGKGVQVCVG